jgi:soluble P-type ATPase
VAPLTGDQELPLLEETSHCTLGVGAPDALALKVAELAVATLTGDSVTAGAVPDDQIANRVTSALKLYVEPREYETPSLFSCVFQELWV